MQVALGTHYRTFVLVFAALLAIAALVAFGLVGIGRGGSERFADVKFWYVAAKTWLQGSNPYDFESYRAVAIANSITMVEGYPYPPQSFVLGLILSPFSYNVASAIWTIINGAALLAILAASQAFLADEAIERGAATEYRTAFAVLAIVTIGNPFTAHVIWTGQTTLLIAAALMWAWRLIYQEKEFVGGLLLAVGLIKPQLSIFVALWLLLDRKLAALTAAAVATLLFIAWPFWVSGPTLVSEWLSAAQTYQAQPSRTLGASYNANLQSVALALGWTDQPVNLRLYLPVAVFSTLLLWLSRRRLQFDRVLVLACLMGLGLLLIFGRDYDYAAMAPLMVAATLVSHRRPSRQIFLAAAALLLFIPHRVIAKLDVAILLSWRPLTMFVVLVAVSYWSYIDTRRKMMNSARLEASSASRA